MEYQFNVVMSGEGETRDQAWEKALNSFFVEHILQNPGPPEEPKDFGDFLMIFRYDEDIEIHRGRDRYDLERLALEIIKRETGRTFKSIQKAEDTFNLAVDYFYMHRNGEVAKADW